MTISELPPYLRELKGAPLALLLALRWVHLPVAQNWLQDATGYQRDTVRAGMRVLKRLGLATYDGDNYCTNCQLTGAAAQLPLGYDLLDRPDQVDPAPPSAEVPLDPAEPSAIKSHSDALIVLIDSESTLSINNNNAPSAKNSQLKRQARERGREIADVIAILAERKLPHAAGDNPLPPQLRPAAARLEALGCSTFRAQEAVALSPWVPDQLDKLLAQIEAWAAHCQAPTNTTIDHRWPYIVAARVKKGVECKATVIDRNDPNRYDGYLNPD